MSHEAGSTEHRWQDGVAKDNARVHNGHVYNRVKNIHNHPPNRTNTPAKPNQSEREWRDALLGWLMFAEIDDRREQVQRAHKETFRWIFKSDHETGFATWLSSGDGIFWIHGKPASGKSTLMKYITQEKRLKELLDVWTRSSPLVVASFYFWVAGSPLQRSLVGLYRTLLHQMLRAEKHMCRIAFPDWQRKFIDKEPTLEMLTAAVQKILASGKLSHNFFIIIDGLDEYDRDSIGKAKLAELMLELSRSPRVKLLLSSRPETPFKIAFQQCRALRLEKLTEPDMSAYINKRLWSNPAVKNNSGVETDSIKEIANFILNNAQGVFLWVVLTLNIALDGIRNREDFATVRDRVKLLPPELDDMFTHILKQRISQRHRCEAFRCLYITYKWHSESTLRGNGTELSYMVVSKARQASTYAEACMLANSTNFESKKYFRERLASMCQGLLETTDGEQNTMGVILLHRTLYDYLNEDQGVQGLLKAGLGETFDVYTAIMAGLICTRKLRLYSGSHLCRVFFHLNMLAEHSTRRSRSELLVIFDKVESIIHDGPVGALHDDGKPKRHWSVNLFKTRPPTESNLLIWAAYCGAERHVQESINKGEVPSMQASSFLLYYALTPIFSVGEMLENWPIGPNIATAALLLNHGADPAYEIGNTNPWAMVLESLVRATTSDRKENSDEMTAALQTLVKLAHGAPDLRKCSAIEVTWEGNPVFTASRTLHGILRARVCCRSGHSVQACHCRKAQSWRSLAMEVLNLVEAQPKIVPETVNAQDHHAKTRGSRKWSLKKLLSWQK